MTTTRIIHLLASSAAQLPPQSIGKRAVFRRLVTVVFFVSFLPLAANAQVQMGCGELTSGYGPYDYTNPIHVREKLPIVEKAHFTFNVENLIRGSSSFDPMSDIAYTLNRFPNHHRALYAMVRYMLKTKNRPAAGQRRSPECWFDRALRFKPDDPAVMTIYGIYLHRLGAFEKSLEQYSAAVALAPNSGELHYNMGLLHFDMKNYSSSREHAARAYELGYPLPALRRKLSEIGELSTPTG